MTAVAPPRPILTDELIDRCGQRAAGYDRDNRFFTEDFEELRAAGYLLAAVPEEFGGHGLSLAEVCREQRRLAYRAPPRRSPPICTSTGPAWPRTSTEPETRPWYGCCGRPRLARSSPPAMASRATTCRCCCRRARPSVWTVGTTSPGARCSAA